MYANYLVQSSPVIGANFTQWVCGFIRDWSLIRGRGLGYKTGGGGGGASEVLPLRKRVGWGGRRTFFLAILKGGGGGIQIWGSFYAVA